MPDPKLNFGCNTDKENTNGQYCNQVNDQNLFDQIPIRNDMNIVGDGEIMYQALRVNEQGFNSNTNGLDLNTHRAQGGVMSCPIIPQPTTRPRFQSNTIDFSQSLLQILASLGINLNETPREGFAIVSACTSDAWREIMSSRCSSQDIRLLKLEMKQ